MSPIAVIAVVVAVVLAGMAAGEFLDTRKDARYAVARAALFAIAALAWLMVGMALASSSARTETSLPEAWEESR